MCWLSKEKPIKKVTIEDKTVYKLLTPDLRAPFKPFRYYYNEKQIEEELKIRTRYDFNYKKSIFEITKGYHSYSKESVISKMKQINEIWIGKYLRIFVCIIPKGSIYYENSDCEVVSSNIVIKKEL